MLLRLVILALISVVAIGCGATPTEKPDSTQGESQPVVESPKSATAVPPTAVPSTAVPPSEEVSKTKDVSPKLVTTSGSTPQGRLLGDGSWVVGDNVLVVELVPPGTYETSNEDGNCSWVRLSGFSGSSDDIVANDTPGGRAIVTIMESDKGFKSDGCGTWKRLEPSG